MSIDIDALIASAELELETERSVPLEVLVAGKVVEFQFTKLKAFAWRELVAKFPPRSGVARDLNLGYNYDLMPSGFPAANIKIVDGDGSVDVSADQWKSLYSIFESPDIFNISTALWGLHEYEPAKALEDAKKKLKRKGSGNSRKR